MFPGFMVKIHYLLQTYGEIESFPKKLTIIVFMIIQSVSNLLKFLCTFFFQKNIGAPFYFISKGTAEVLSMPFTNMKVAAGTYTKTTFDVSITSLENFKVQDYAKKFQNC